MVVLDSLYHRWQGIFNLLYNKCVNSRSVIVLVTSIIGCSVIGSLTLCFPLDFHNPLQHSPLRLIFLSNFKIFLVIVCHCVV